MIRTTTARYADGRKRSITVERDDLDATPIMDLIAEVREQYPNSVAYDRAGERITEERDYDSENSVLVWESEEASENDDGSKAICVISDDF